MAWCRAGTTSALVFGCPLRDRDGRALRGSVGLRDADHRRAGAQRPGAARAPADQRRRGARRRHEADRALARSRPPALRGDAAILAVGVGADARGLRGAARDATAPGSPPTSTRTAPRSTRWRPSSPSAAHYLDTYAHHGLVIDRSVLAHNVHPTDHELEVIGAAGACVAHCPTSNAALGSGLFPLRRHVAHGVGVALGSDVGGGTGFCLLKEGLQAYFAQQLLGPEGYPLAPVHLLYLATRAGARALGLADQVGDFGVGKQFDAVWLRPQPGSTLDCRPGPRQRRQRGSGQDLRPRDVGRRRRGLGRRSPASNLAVGAPTPSPDTRPEEAA